MSSRAKRALSSFNNQRRQAPAGGSGKRSGQSRSRTFTLEGDDLWAPWGWPDLDDKIQFNECWYLQEGDTMNAILMDESLEFDTHTFNAFPNPEVLQVSDPRKMKRELYKPSLCHFTDIRDILSEAMSGELSEEKKDLLRDISENAEVQELDSELRVVHGPYQVSLVPAGHDGDSARYVLDYKTKKWSTRGNDLGAFVYEEALSMAYMALLTQMSCPMCYYERSWWDKPKGEDAPPKPEVRNAYPLSVIPLFNLDWLVASEQKGRSDRSYLKFGYKLGAQPIPSGWTPGEEDVAIRRGFGYLRTTPAVSANSSRYRTLENYRDYRAQLATVDLLAVRDSSVKNSRDLFSEKYRISILDLVCPSSEEPLVDVDDYPDETSLVEASEELHPSAALTAEVLACPEDMREALMDSWDFTAVFNDEDDQVYVLPKVIAESPSGSDFQRLRVSDVVTEVTKEEGGFFVFNVAISKDRKVVRDWAEVAATNPPEYSIQEAVGEQWSVPICGDDSARSESIGTLVNTRILGYRDLSRKALEDLLKM